MTPTVVRVGGEIQQEVEPIPFTEQRQADPNLPIGQTRVAQNGVDGVMTLTYKVTTENGAQAGRTLLSKVPAVAAIAADHRLRHAGRLALGRAREV